MSGFSFGGGSTGSSTPSGGGSLFGGGAAKTEEKKDEAGKAADAAKPAAVVASSIQTKTLEDIVNMWSAELEEHVSSFTKAAMQVATYDRQILENGDKYTRARTPTSPRTMY